MDDREGTRASAVVEAFCRTWSSLDFERICSYFSEDIVYINGPAAPVAGRTAVRAMLERMARGLERCDFVITRLAEGDGRVYTERVDEVRFRGVDAILDVVGVFEVANGQITYWREYFDLAQHLDAMGVAPRPG